MRSIDVHLRQIAMGRPFQRVALAAGRVRCPEGSKRADGPWITGQVDCRGFAALTIALSLACIGQAAAQDTPEGDGPRAAEVQPGRGLGAPTAPSFEVTTFSSSLQRPVAPHSRLGAPLGQELVGVSFSRWVTRGRVGLGMGLGSLGHVPSSADGAATMVGAVPLVTVGMRYRLSSQHLLYADASGARGLGDDSASRFFSTRAGLEWKPSRSTLAFEHGAIGLRLDSGYRLSLKPRRGGLALYLRGAF